MKMLLLKNWYFFVLHDEWPYVVHYSAKMSDDLEVNQWGQPYIREKYAYQLTYNLRCHYRWCYSYPTCPIDVQTHTHVTDHSVIVTVWYNDR